jgi:hypothetical protein
LASKEIIKHRSKRTSNEVESPYGIYGKNGDERDPFGN